MKNALLASTALVAMSGAAFAQGVTLTGAAEMGLADNGIDGARFHQDVDVTFKMEAMTDGGLTFGTSVDLDEAAGKVGVASAGVAAYIKGPFGNFTLGSTDGAFDWALAEVDGAGAIAANHTGHAGFNGNRGLDGDNYGSSTRFNKQILRYDNTFGDFGFGVSFEQDHCDINADAGLERSATALGLDPAHSPTGTAPADCTGKTGATKRGDAVGVGAKGSFSGFGVGVGFQRNDHATIAGMSVSATMGELTGVLNYSAKSDDANNSDASDDTDTTHTGVGVTYTSGLITLHANFGRYDIDKGGVNMDADGFGVAAQYDLGGGAKLQAGFGSSDKSENAPTAANPYANVDTDTWSLGLSMSF